MAGLEVVVRPVVFPAIRPAPPRVLPQEDDPENGVAVIGGTSGRLIDLPYSFSMSSSKQRMQETERLVDEERIHQVDENGNVNENNYVDVQRTKASRFDNGDGSSSTITYGNPPQPQNVVTTEVNKVIQLPMDTP